MSGLRRALLGLCLGGLSCAAGPPRGGPAAARLAPGSPGDPPACTRALAQRGRADELLAEGRLLRAVQAVDEADALCPEQRHRSWGTRLEALVLLEQVPQARRLADEIETSPLASARDLRQASAAARALWQLEGEMRDWAVLGAEAPFERQVRFAEAAHRHEVEGRPAEARRLYDRARLNLERMVNDPVRVWLRGGLGFTGAVAWSPDSQRLALSDIERVLIFDRGTGQVSHAIEGESTVRALAFSPSGDLFIGDMGGLRRWAPGGGGASLRERDAINALVLSPDGRWLFSASESGVICQRDPATLACQAPLGSHGARALALAASPGILASGGADGRVFFWDIAARKELFHQNFSEDQRPGDEVVRALSFSADARYLAVGTAQLHLLDASTGVVQVGWQEHQGRVAGLAWSPDRPRLFLGAEDRTIRSYNTTCGSDDCSQRQPNKGRLLASWSGEHEGWRTSVLREAYEVFWREFQRSNQRASVGLAPVIPALQVGHVGAIHGLAASPDGKLLAAATGVSGAWLVAPESEAAPQLNIIPLREKNAVLVTSSDGHVDTSGADDVVECRLGMRAFWFGLCRDRLQVDGLGARVLRGDLSFLSQ